MSNQTLALVLLSLCTQQGIAATFCVTNTSELQSALASAATNQQSDEIRIRTGIYNTPVGGFVFDNVAPVQGDNLDITISGGWTPFLISQCGQQSSASAFDTVLNASNSGRVLRVIQNINTDVTIRLLTFQNGNTLGFADGSGAGLRINNNVSYQGDVTVESNVFSGNDAGNFGGGFAGGAGGKLQVVNNLFFANTADCTHGAASITQSGTGVAYIVNNTVAYNSVGNACIGGVPLPAGGLRIGGTSKAILINNLSWGNEFVDLVLDSSPLGAQLTANNFQNLLGTPTPDSGINWQFPPRFAPGLFNVRLGDNSPLIDRGVVPGGGSAWYIPPRDLDASPRVNGLRVDLGAFENQTAVFSDGFE